MLSQQQIKQHVAQQALQFVDNNITIGLGSGSTAYWFILALAEKVKQGFAVTAVPTSQQTRILAIENGIPVTALNDITTIRVTVDGADEIDKQLQLIKGGGGALLQEKMVAAASEKLVIIADHSKLVPQLGKFPLPVEVIPYSWKQVQQVIEKKYSIKTYLRLQDTHPFITDHGHYILDCHFQQIPYAPILNNDLNNIPGVVENGLFIDMATTAIIGYPDGTIKMLEK